MTAFLRRLPARLAAASIAACLAHAAAQQPSSTLLDVRRRLNEPETSFLAYRSIDQIFETRAIPAGGQPRKLEARPAPLAFTYVSDGRTLDAAGFAARTNTHALLILKNGVLVHEGYFNHAGPGTKFLAMSVSKSFTSALFGVAMDEGLIQSIDDPVVKYAPELAGTPFDGVTLRNVLEMRTGIDRNDSSARVPGSVHERMRERTLISNQMRVVDEAYFIGRKAQPGGAFEYSTLNTNVLGRVIENVTGKTFEAYLSEKIWRPMGAEAAGYVLVDGAGPEGRAVNGMGVNGVARDFARFGLLMLDGGAVGGRQVIPAAWVAQSTRQVEGREPVSRSPEQGYAFQWWTLPGPNKAYLAVGLGGQYIFIDPATRTVVVRLATPAPDAAPGSAREVYDFFAAASAWTPK